MEMMFVGCEYCVRVLIRLLHLCIACIKIACQLARFVAAAFVCRVANGALVVKLTSPRSRWICSLIVKSVAFIIAYRSWSYSSGKQ